MDLRELRQQFRSMDDEHARALIGDILDIYKMEQARKNTVAVMSFDIGDKVTFKGRYGDVWTGKVTKVNRTTVTVLAMVSNRLFGSTDKESPVSWRVHPTNLKKVE